MILGGTVVATILNAMQEPLLLSWTWQLRFMSLIRISSTLRKWTLCSTGQGIASETVLSKISFRLLFVDKFLICSFKSCCNVFRWFKFTLKPPYTITHGNLLMAIWDTSHWTSFVKFGLKTAWDISYDILWPILKYVNFWRLQGHLSNLSKKDAFRKSIFSPWRSDKASMRLAGFRWAGP